MKILIFGLGGIFGASRREHVEHVEHMNGIIDEDQTKELRVSSLVPSTFIGPSTFNSIQRLSYMVCDQFSRQVFRKWNQKKPKRLLKNFL